MDPRVVEALREASLSFRENEPFSRHTTMGVGGPAAVMAFPRTTTELQKTLALRDELGVPHRVLGGGSNLVVVDEGLDELVINTEDMRRVEIREAGSVTAEGGAWPCSSTVASGSNAGLPASSAARGSIVPE